MFKSYSYIYILLLLLPGVMFSQVDDKTVAFITVFNEVLSNEQLPQIADIDQVFKSRPDDFTFVKNTLNLFEPHDRNQGECSECPFFAIPKTSLLGYSCIAGDCLNDDGILEIEKNHIYYVGTFENTLAHGQGVLYFVNQGFFKGIFKEGYLTEAYFLGKDLQSAKIVNNPDKVIYAERWYHLKYDTFYDGGLNSDLMPIKTEKEIKLYSPYVNMVAQFDTTNQLSGFYGAIVFEGSGKVTGNYDTDLNLLDGTIIWERITGEVLQATTKSGEIQRDKVRITNGNTIYEGQVDENYKPHGKGIAVSNGKRLVNEVWIHGAPEKEEPSEERDLAVLIANLKESSSKNWSKIFAYGIYKQNFTVNTKGTKKLLLLNLSKEPITFKAKLNFVTNNSTFGFKGKWIEIYIPASKSLTGSLTDLGRKEELIPFPYEQGNYEIKLKGDNLDKVFWVFAHR